jgi:hypothetical protein
LLSLKKIVTVSLTMSKPKKTAGKKAHSAKTIDRAIVSQTCPFCFGHVRLAVSPETQSGRCPACFKHVLLEGDYRLVFKFQAERLTVYFPKPEQAFEYVRQKLDDYYRQLKIEDFSLYEQAKAKWEAYLDPYARDLSEIISETK